MSIYSAIHNGADPTTKRPVFNTRIVPSSALRQQREHSWVWFRQGLIWRQVSQIPRGYHSNEAIGRDVCLSVQKVTWFWCRMCKKKKSLFTVCPVSRIGCLILCTPEFAERAEQNLWQCLSMETGEVTLVHLAASEQVVLRGFSTRISHRMICCRGTNINKILTKY